MDITQENVDHIIELRDGLRRNILGLRQIGTTTRDPSKELRDIIDFEGDDQALFGFVCKQITQWRTLLLLEQKHAQENFEQETQAKKEEDIRTVKTETSAARKQSSSPDVLPTETATPPPVEDWF